MSTRISYTFLLFATVFLCMPCAGIAMGTAVQIKPIFPDLTTASIEDLNEGLALGLFTSVDLVRAYISRIQEVNSLFHAVGEINVDAVAIAKARDKDRRLGKLRGPLHGIPVLLKDNIATTDRLSTTAGSFALLGSRPSREATIVKKLRAAGGIVLGKATLGEWAQYRSFGNYSSHGWSPSGGQAMGAYCPQQDPHGSSSGSAISVALGLTAIAIGTETSGSIVNPSEKANLVGIKPTLGLTSRTSVIPISYRQDVVGPMARTVKDAATLLTVIAGPDKLDNWTMIQPLPVPDFAKACERATLREARIGVPRNGILPFVNEQTAPVMAAFEDAIHVIKSRGARMVDQANFSTFDFASLLAGQKIVLETDFLDNIAHYLSTLQENPTGVKSLQDLLEFTLADPREEAFTRGTDVWEEALRSNFTNRDFKSWEAYQSNLHLATTAGITDVLDRLNLDALIMPTFTAFYLCGIGGLPAVTVPLGFYPPNTPVKMNAIGTMVEVGPGVPFGISFVGRAWSEQKLIELAHAYEQASQVRKIRTPYLVPTTTLEDVVSHRPIRNRNKIADLPIPNIGKWISRNFLEHDWTSVDALFQIT